MRKGEAATVASALKKRPCHVLANRPLNEARLSETRAFEKCCMEAVVVWYNIFLEIGNATKKRFLTRSKKAFFKALCDEVVAQ